MQHLTAGIDEVGTGSFTHPTVICCCVLGYNIPNGVVKDSKKFSSEKQRSVSAYAIKEAALYYKTYVVNELGPTFNEAMAQAVYEVMCRFHDIYVVVDGSNDYGLGIKAIPKADSTHMAVAAASIVAKDYRDTIMNNIATHNDYGFKNHKGYGTPEHIAALEKWGPLKGIHRMNIEKVQKSVK